MAIAEIAIELRMMASFKNRSQISLLVERRSRRIVAPQAEAELRPIGGIECRQTPPADLAIEVRVSRHGISRLRWRCRRKTQKKPYIYCIRC